METLRDVLVRNNKARLFLAYWRGDVVAGAFIVHDSNIGVYQEAASSDVGKKLGANDLIQ